MPFYNHNRQVGGHWGTNHMVLDKARVSGWGGVHDRAEKEERWSQRGFWEEELELLLQMVASLIVFLEHKSNVESLCLGFCGQLWKLHPSRLLLILWDSTVLLSHSLSKRHQAKFLKRANCSPRILVWFAASARMSGTPFPLGPLPAPPSKRI